MTWLWRIFSPSRGLDWALTQISLRDDVQSVEVKPDHQVVIVVKGPVSDSYSEITRLLKHHSPGTHGFIQSEVHSR